MPNKRLARHQEIHLRGHPICAGIAIARPFFFIVAEQEIPEFSVPREKIDDEVARYYHAIKHSQTDLVSLQKRMLKEGGGEAAAILGTHLEMIRDPLMTMRVEQKIRHEGKNTEYVFKSVIGEYERKFSKITNTFFRERVKDFQDISRRVIGHLKQHDRCKLSDLARPSVVFAHELAPSDTAEANTQVIEAFVTRIGSETCHAAIMARAKGIPFVSGVDFPDLCLAMPPLVIVDGASGDVIINPSQETLTRYVEEKRKCEEEAQALQKNASHIATTSDGYVIRLSANIELFEELDSLAKFGAQGVGLFRSEYLCLASGVFPSEEEQFQLYKALVEKIQGEETVIRSFDIGGDKLGNFNLQRHEENPYLGCRAIRLMLKEPETFKCQMRAMLRASAFGRLKILFPMISGVAELREAKAVIETAKGELDKEGIPFAADTPVGCMIEVPSAALTADLLAQECDFLSIGTNDLVQYALAVDRGNPAMSYLYTPTHPSIIRLIKMVVTEANKAQIPLSVCGEIAGDPLFTPLLVGLGVHELSLSLPALPPVKDAVCKLSLFKAQELADHILTLTTTAEILDALHTQV